MTIKLCLPCAFLSVLALSGCPLFVNTNPYVYHDKSTIRLYTANLSMSERTDSFCTADGRIKISTRCIRGTAFINYCSQGDGRITLLDTQPRGQGEITIDPGCYYHSFRSTVVVAGDAKLVSTIEYNASSAEPTSKTRLLTSPAAHGACLEHSECTPPDLCVYYSCQRQPCDESILEDDVPQSPVKLTADCPTGFVCAADGFCAVGDCLLSSECTWPQFCVANVCQEAPPDDCLEDRTCPHGSYCIWQRCGTPVCKQNSDVAWQYDCPVSAGGEAWNCIEDECAAAPVCSDLADCPSVPNGYAQACREWGSTLVVGARCVSWNLQPCTNEPCSSGYECLDGYCHKSRPDTHASGAPEGGSGGQPEGGGMPGTGGGGVGGTRSSNDCMGLREPNCDSEALMRCLNYGGSPFLACIDTHGTPTCDGQTFTSCPEGTKTVCECTGVACFRACDPYKPTLPAACAPSPICAAGTNRYCEDDVGYPPAGTRTTVRSVCLLPAASDASNLKCSGSAPTCTTGSPVCQCSPWQPYTNNYVACFWQCDTTSP